MNDFFTPLLSGIAMTFLENPWGQTLGFIAMIIGLMGYIVTDDRTTIKIFIASCIFWIFHFIFMANYGALGATTIGLVRLFLSLKYRGNMNVLLGVLTASVIFGVWSFDGKLISILPLLATSISSYGFFFLAKAKLRMLLAGVSLMWLVYHLQTGSMSGVLNEVIVQITIYISIYKFLFGKERKIYMKERIKYVLGKRPSRINYGRYVFFRDKNRFE